MYDINACYKIIFEAMAEDKALKNITEQIYGYAKCQITFLSGSGRLMEAAGFQEEGRNPFSFIDKKHMSWKDYELFFIKKKCADRYLHAEPVYDKKRIIGYVLLGYKEQEESAFFEELGKFLAQISVRYYAKEQENYIYNQSFRKHINAWTIMEDDVEIDNIAWMREGKYIAALFLKTDVATCALTGFLRENASSAYVYEDGKAVRILFYKLTDQSAEKLYGKIEECQLKGCVSELFADRHLCRAKQHLLERIAGAGEPYQDIGIRRENEWYVPGVYSYAAPLIEEAGLSDYAFQKLLREDEEKHTELYETLKQYLMCENNITAAAKKLHIHRNTMVYRIKQIETCLGVDINDNKKSGDLLAFIMMHDMVSRKQEKR